MSDYPTRAVGGLFVLSGIVGFCWLVAFLAIKVL